MKIAAVFATVVALAAAGAADATVFIVDAQANSSTGGTPLAAIALTAGQSFSVNANPNDLWSAGSLPRYSDADGLVATRYATDYDDSGQPVGTQIGANFGLYTMDGFSAPYGALVGLIGSTYTLLGTNFHGMASGTGTLELLYWDSNSGDNTGSIAASVAVPEPAAWMLMIAGFGLVGTTLRRRTGAIAA